MTISEPWEEDKYFSCWHNYSLRRRSVDNLFPPLFCCRTKRYEDVRGRSVPPAVDSHIYVHFFYTLFFAAHAFDPSII